MKRILTFALVLAALATTETYAQSSATANVSLSVNTALSVNKTRDLSFGNQVVGATATVSPTNGVNAGNAAYFQILASTSTPVTVTVTPSANLSNGATTPTLIPWSATYSWNSTNSQASATDVSGTSPFTETTNSSLVGGYDLFVWVGGSVTIPTGTPQGQYSGTVTLSVSY